MSNNAVKAGFFGTFGVILALLFIFVVLPAGLVIFACGGCALLVSTSQPMTASSAPSSSKSGASKSVATQRDTWKPKNFQDEGIDVNIRDQTRQQARWKMLEVFFENISTPGGNVVEAQIKRDVRDGWYSDDVLRKNIAGTLYAYYFPDSSGTVTIFDNGKQIGEYRWDNGPQYSDLAAKKSPRTESEVAKVSREASEQLEKERETERLAEIEKAAERERQAKAERTRTWQSPSGKFSVEAEFVRYSNGKVTLRKADDSEIEVDVAKLCDDDKAWIEEQRKK